MSSLRASWRARPVRLNPLLRGLALSVTPTP
jgi:hypothetical protein